MAVLNTLSVGDTVTLNVGGVPTDFILVHKGLPSSVYDSSCDGAWLTTKDLYTYMSFMTGDAGQDFSTSKVKTYLNDTFLNLLDEPIRNAIKEVKIPYTKNNSGLSVSVQSGANGVSCKVFVPSAAEVDGSTKDGANLSYFNSATRRTARYEGVKDAWWTRTTGGSGAMSSPWLVRYVSSAGAVKASGWVSNYDEEYCIRPTFILPLDIDPDNLGGMNGKVNVEGAWKDISGLMVNIGGTWKETMGIYGNIGGTWNQS